jgi:REP element-mobilizing transposase RayT
MLRKARIDAPGALHHIIIRGIERRRIFSNDQARDDFMERLCNIVTETKTSCFAWALIPNHALNKILNLFFMRISWKSTCAKNGM